VPPKNVCQSREAGAVSSGWFAEFGADIATLRSRDQSFFKNVKSAGQKKKNCCIELAYRLRRGVKYMAEIVGNPVLVMRGS
jgi:hypothetical protein